MAVKRSVMVPEELDAVVLNTTNEGEEFAGKPYTYVAVELMRRGAGMLDDLPEPTNGEIMERLRQMSGTMESNTEHLVQVERRQEELGRIESDNDKVLGSAVTLLTHMSEHMTESFGNIRKEMSGYVIHRITMYGAIFLAAIAGTLLGSFVASLL